VVMKQKYKQGKAREEERTTNNNSDETKFQWEMKKEKVKDHFCFFVSALFIFAHSVAFSFPFLSRFFTVVAIVVGQHTGCRSIVAVASFGESPSDSTSIAMGCLDLAQQPSLEQQHFGQLRHSASRTAPLE